MTMIFGASRFDEATKLKMSQEIWKPHVVVAAIVEQDGKFPAGRGADR
jgi:hypothetical protein